MVLKAQIARVERGEVDQSRSHRVAFDVHTRRASVHISEHQDFFPPVGHAQMHACLGSAWRGRVEGSSRPGWRAPAIVYEAPGKPSVILLEDGAYLQILIEGIDQ